MTRGLLLILLFTLFRTLAIAQATPPAETPAPSPAPMAAATPPVGTANLLRYQAVVQFVSGQVEKIETKEARSPVVFKTIIYEGERIQLTPGSMIKFVTRNDCTAVVYGEATIAPPKAERPWRLKADALRWICPDGVTETVGFNDQKFVNTGGEFLVEKTKALAVRGNITAAGTKLVEKRICTFDGKQWNIPEKYEVDPFEVWNFNQSRKPPQESLVWAKPPRTDLPYATRWIGTMVKGATSVFYNVDGLSQQGLDEGLGVRLQMHKQSGDASWIFAFTFNDRFSPIQRLEVASDLKLFSLEVGRRRWHESWWSPYWRAGIGIDYATIEINRPTRPYFSKHEYEFYVLTGALGLDLLFGPKWLDGLGVYGAAEFYVTQSLSRGARITRVAETSAATRPPEAAEAWRLTSVGGQIMLGAVYQY